ncbi:MAG: nitroreductase family protein [Clostridium sp.]
MENIFLAAHSFGIGSVWINQLRASAMSLRSGNPEWLCIPADHVVCGMAALGYADDVKAEKRNGKVVVVE